MGFYFVAASKCWLVGEVMVSWHVNDPKKFGGEPSFDFLVVDAEMRLTAIEVKTILKGAKSSWDVLCQITHCATECTRTLSLENIE